MVINLSLMETYYTDIYTYYYSIFTWKRFESIRYGKSEKVEDELFFFFREKKKERDG